MAATLDVAPGGAFCRRRSVGAGTGAMKRGCRRCDAVGAPLPRFTRLQAGYERAADGQQQRRMAQGEIQASLRGNACNEGVA